MAASETGTIRSKSTRALWVPIILLETYLAFTVAVFFFGPVDWYVPSVTKLLIFLLVNYGALWFGYSRGIMRGKIALKQSEPGQVGIIKVPSQLMTLILFSMVFTIVSNTVRLYAIRGGIEAFASSFMSPGEAYRQAQVLAQMDRNGEIMPIANFSWFFRISTLLAVFNGLYFPLALICWRRMRIAYRVIFFVALLSSIVFTTGMGAQFGIGLLFFSLLPVVLYKLYVVARPMTVGAKGVAVRKTGGNRAFAKVLIALSICAFVATVAWFQLDRAENSGRRLDAARDLGSGFSSPSEHGLVPITGGRLNYGLVMACMYVSHGYEGLALAMELPFEPTYGLGWSGALQSIYRDYLGGEDLFQRSYLRRSTQRYGWPAQWWSTIFPWIASDTTYYGTVLFMALVGFVIGRCWVAVIITGNPIGFAVLAQMFTLVFMFPANNALAQTLDALCSLIGVLLIYSFSWRYFKPTRRMAIRTSLDRKRTLASFPVRTANMSGTSSR